MVRASASGAEGRGFDPGQSNTKDVKSGTSGYLAWCSALKGKYWLLFSPTFIITNIACLFVLNMENVFEDYVCFKKLALILVRIVKAFKICIIVTQTNLIRNPHYYMYSLLIVKYFAGPSLKHLKSCIFHRPHRTFSLSQMLVIIPDIRCYTTSL